MRTGRPLQDVRVRFERNVSPEPNTGCWLWTGAVDMGGYGVFHRRDSTSRAHRASYEIHVGPIPKGFCVCHRCDQPSCVNPAHLFLGTIAENNTDRSRKGRTNRVSFPKPRGEGSPTSKITDAQRLAICALVDAGGRTKRSIAIEFGVSPQLISTLLVWSRA